MSSVIELHAGDRLLIVTDGVTEAKDRNNGQFGEARIPEFLSAIVPGDARPLACLLSAVRAFEDGEPAFDDVAALFLEISDVVGFH
jgi:sigma-B regulation protein RsbU (phosphoserine phosphatase)